LNGPVKYLVEAKDYTGTLGMDECREFLGDYGTLVDSGYADHAWLISKGPVSPDGRALVDAKRRLKCMTFAEFQRRLMGLDGYLHDLLAAYNTEGSADWYIRPHTMEGADLENVVRAWIDEPDPLPNQVSIGQQKCRQPTFALHSSLRPRQLRDML